MNTLRLLLLKLTTPKSGAPSPDTSTAATAKGVLPTASGDAGDVLKPPAPLPRRSTTEPGDPSTATARSSLPSRLRSATAMSFGLPPTATGEPAALVKEPDPRRRIETFEEE